MKVVWCSEINRTVLILSCNNSSVHRWKRVWDLLIFQTFLYYTRVHLSVKWKPVIAAYSSIHLLHAFMLTHVCYFWQYLKMLTLTGVCVCVCVYAHARTQNFVSNWEKLLSRLSRAHTKFCFKLGKTIIETFKMLQKVFGYETMSHMRIYKLHRRFKDNRTSTEDYPRLDCLQPQVMAIPLSKV